MLFFKVVKFLVKPWVWLLLPTKIIHRENFLKTKSVVCCNHYHSFDSLILGARLLRNGMYCLAKEEIFKTKFIKWLFLKLGAIPVKRGAPDKECFQRSLQVLANGDNLVLFPEGTRNREGSKELLPLHDGASVFALRGDAPIVPMLYYQPPKLFRKNYLIIGEAINLDEYKGRREKEIRSEVTQKLRDAMLALRKEVDDIVENKKGRIK